MSKTRCPKCRGAKQIMGNGCMWKECPECEGVGTIEKEVEPVEIEAVLPVVTPKKAVKTVKKTSKPEAIPTKEEAPIIELAEPEKPKLAPEIEMGQMMGFTPFMVEAIMNEPKMDPLKWREKYFAVILNPLSLHGEPGKQYLPGTLDRKSFRESIARQKKIEPRKVNQMAAQDMPGILEGN